MELDSFLLLGMPRLLVHVTRHGATFSGRAPDAPLVVEPGRPMVFSYALWELEDYQPKHVIGTARGYCDALDDELAHCRWTLTVQPATTTTRDEQQQPQVPSKLVLQGDTKLLQYGTNHEGSQNFAIVGGTGAYFGARGFVEVTTRIDSFRLYTVHLR